MQNERSAKVIHCEDGDNFKDIPGMDGNPCIIVLHKKIQK